MLCIKTPIDAICRVQNATQVISGYRPQGFNHGGLKHHTMEGIATNGDQKALSSVAACQMSNSGEVQI
jgi:hypothetical protein